MVLVFPFRPEASLEQKASTRCRQSILDEEHLRLLSFGYWISAGVTAVCSVFGLFYVLMGAFFGFAMSQVPVKPGQEPPAGIGLFFALIGAVVFAACVALVILKARTALCLKNRRSRVFCMVTGGISCLFMPWGTVLGVCTLLVLQRPSVIALFDSTRAQSPSVEPPPPAQ
jgi:hypothetical protein